MRRHCYHISSFPIANEVDLNASSCFVSVCLLARIQLVQPRVPCPVLSCVELAPNTTRYSQSSAHSDDIPVTHSATMATYSCALSLTSPSRTLQTTTLYSHHTLQTSPKTPTIALLALLLANQNAPSEQPSEEMPAVPSYFFVVIANMN